MRMTAEKSVGNNLTGPANMLSALFEAKLAQIFFWLWRFLKHRRKQIQKCILIKEGCILSLQLSPEVGPVHQHRFIRGIPESGCQKSGFGMSSKICCRMSAAYSDGHWYHEGLVGSDTNTLLLPCTDSKYSLLRLNSCTLGSLWSCQDALMWLPVVLMKILHPSDFVSVWI